MFDELLNPPPSVVNQTPEAIAPIAKVIPPVIPQDIEDDNLDMEVAYMGNDPLFGVPILEEELNEFERLEVYVYVSQPDGFIDPVNLNHVYKLKKALYELKQALRAWYDMLSSFLLSQDFSKGSVDPTLFIRKNGNELLMISQSPRGIFINQSKYALESLKKYGFESCDPVDTPMVEKSKLDEDKEGKAIDPSHYHGMIGTLLYLTANRPYLQFAICMCARYQARPTENTYMRLNLTKPDTYRSDLKRREAYTAYSNPRGFIYQNRDKKNRLMQIDKLHKFNDGTLNDVRNALDDRLKGIRMQYLPTTIWRKGDKDRAASMIQAIKKMLKTRRIMRSLERFVGGRQYKGDFRML
nr:hypothetical protein [Tanacetum cinerariifolium]